MKYLFSIVIFSFFTGCTGFSWKQIVPSSPQPNQTSTSLAETFSGSLDPIWKIPSTRLQLSALPLGDGKFTSAGPKKGYVYTCDDQLYSFSVIIGAQTIGPWVNSNNMTFDVTAKSYIQGTVSYGGQLNVAISGQERVFAGNGLPIGISTGVFPVQSSDPGFQFDPNPNSIEAQNISFSLPSNPIVAGSPFCTYKRVGITLDGVELDAPLDSSGRDENGYELTDSCDGKPQPGGFYHRQYLSGCTPHMNEKNALVGYALDGFGIYSPFDADGNEIVSADLDECHGTTSEVMWDGKLVNMYHYVMTRDFPYTVTCFRGQPNYRAFPPLPSPPGATGTPPPDADVSDPSSLPSQNPQALPSTACMIYISGSTGQCSWLSPNRWFSDDYNNSASDDVSCLTRADQYFQYCGLGPGLYVNAAFTLGPITVSSRQYSGPYSAINYGVNWEPIQDDSGQALATNGVPFPIGSPPPSSCMVYISGSSGSCAWVQGNSWFSDNSNNSASDGDSCLARAAQYYTYCGLSSGQYVNAAFQIGTLTVYSQQYRGPGNYTDYGVNWEPLPASGN